MECFEGIKNLLTPLFGVQEKRRCPSQRLMKLLRDSINFQYYMAKQTGSMTTLKFDPVNQCSEASLLKDLTNIDTQQKFTKQNLSEVKIAFYNRRGGGLVRQSAVQNPLEMSAEEVPEEIDYQEDDKDDDDDVYDRDFA